MSDHCFECVPGLLLGLDCFSPMVDIGVIFFASSMHAFAPSFVALLAWLGSCARAQVESIAKWFALRIVGFCSSQRLRNFGSSGLAFSLTLSFGWACAFPFTFCLAFAFPLGSAVPFAWSEASLLSRCLAAGLGGRTEASFSG